MFCVIQEIETRKPNKSGYSKYLEAYYFSMKISGQECGHWSYIFSTERFERSIKKAYRISIHNSYRENGKVRKKQYVICTARYYDLATGIFCLYDWGNYKIESVAAELNVSAESIYELIESKLEPLTAKIEAEFMETEEYKTHAEHEKITTIHAAKKVEFAHEYGVDASEYDKIYDVFGNLKNAEYLEQIKTRSKFQKEYEEKSRNYYKQNQSNYNYEDYFRGYSKSNSDNYTEENKKTLKQFYKVLSKKFHPDANPDTDTSKEMQLLNQLKEQWGL